MYTVFVSFERTAEFSSDYKEVSLCLSLRLSECVAYVLGAQDLDPRVSVDLR